MAENIFESLKNLFKGKPKVSKEGLRTVNVREMEKLYEADDFAAAAQMLIDLLEIYGVRKKKNHRLKGREFIHFILSHKHKDLKNIGYTHWQNLNKILHVNHDKVYPYHKENLRNAMDFFRKEITSINSLDIVIE
ncbi:MAG: hypothetical protein JXR62_03985 [Bacilli bacterium]|nr:hypothetical protein [Bacilli bacterium]